MIYSYVALSVEQYLKGVSHERQITVKYQGGEVGDIAAFVSEEPVFTVGERVKLFLKLEKTGEFGVVGGKLGKISLTDIGVGEPASYGYSGIHWKAVDIPVKYYINNLGTPDVPGTIEFYAVQASFDTWEIDPQSYMDYTYMGTTTRMEGYDGYNVVSWDYMDGPGGVLAHCVYWYWPSTEELVEFDITFDEGDAWSVSGEAGKFDIQNVGTHEAGHTLVLNDLYNPAENKETMYGYSSTGQVSKRTLYTGDLAGLRYIYPIGTILAPDLMISIETDKPTYRVGDTMRLGIEVINHGSSRTVAAKVWVTLPTGATYTILEYPSVTVPSGFEYIDMSWQTYTLPALSTGKYVWHATLKYTGSTVSEDIATFYIVP
jgi:Tfp pilus assembly protein PilZ